MFVFSSVRSPSPLSHRKRSPRGVAFGCSTRCAKSTNFGCECGSIGNWRRERKQHIFVNAVNAKVGWIRIDWMKDWILIDIFCMNERDIISYVKFVNEPVAMLRCVASGLIITSPSPVLAKMQRLLSKHSFFRDRQDVWKLNNQVNPLNDFCCGERDWLGHKFPTKFGFRRKKNRISNINFQHKFLNLSLLPYYNSFRQTESLLQPWALLRGLRENQPLQAMAWLQPTNQPMGKAGHKNFWKITNWNPQKNGGWMVQTI